ncbi:hypothetical protein MTO96_034701 [Rhipicephalus appendiculatus]
MKNRAAIANILLLGSLVVPYLPAVAGECHKWDFDCGNGRCVSPSMMCDGTDRCGNNADEEGCASGSVVCPACSFACHNGKGCMYPWFVCDGDHDCGDGSDEKNCPEARVPALNCSLSRSPEPTSATPSSDNALPVATSPTSPSPDCNVDDGGFSCPDGRCLLPVQVCDGVRDCCDGADEGPLCRFFGRGNQQPQQLHDLRGWLLDLRMQLRVLPPVVEEFVQPNDLAVTQQTRDKALSPDVPHARRVGKMGLLNSFLIKLLDSEIFAMRC